jgi:hypothetical protein
MHHFIPTRLRGDVQVSRGEAVFTTRAPTSFLSTHVLEAWWTGTARCLKLLRLTHNNTPRFRAGENAGGSPAASLMQLPGSCAECSSPFNPLLGIPAFRSSIPLGRVSIPNLLFVFTHQVEDECVQNSTEKLSFDTYHVSSCF